MIMKKVFSISCILCLMSVFPWLAEGQCTEFTSSEPPVSSSGSVNVGVSVTPSCNGDGNFIRIQDSGNFLYGPAGASGTVTFHGYGIDGPVMYIEIWSDANAPKRSGRATFTMGTACTTYSPTVSIVPGQYVYVSTGLFSTGTVLFDKACIGGSNPLPVELTSFRAFVRNDHVELKWTTATELNNYGFEVQKRKGDGIWEPIGFVQGAGTSSTPLHYSFGDETPLKSVTTYRLKQVDRDGTTTFSEEVTVQPLTADITGLQAYPNPLLNEGHLSFELSETQTVSIAVYDLSGRMVRRIADAEQMDAGRAFIPLSASGLNPGQYTVAVYTASGMRTVRISKLR